MDDEKRIVECLARMRDAMVDSHPEQLPGSVSDVLECALNIESFQKELISDGQEMSAGLSVKNARIKQLEGTLAAIVRHYDHPMKDHNWATWAKNMAQSALTSTRQEDKP